MDFQKGETVALFCGGDRSTLAIDLVLCRISICNIKFYLQYYSHANHLKLVIQIPLFSNHASMKLRPLKHSAQAPLERGRTKLPSHRREGNLPFPFCLVLKTLVSLFGLQCTTSTQNSQFIRTTSLSDREKGNDKR